MLRDTPQPVRLQDYRPPAFLIDRVELHFDLDAAATRVRSRLHLRRNPAAPQARDLRLHGEALELLSIALDGRPLPAEAYTLDAAGLTLPEVPDAFLLDTEVRVHPERNTALEGLYRSGPMLCTQCEAEGFRRITFFLDRPDVMARFRVTLEADAGPYPVLLSNGNPVSLEDLPGGRRRAVWEDPFPKPCYLFALVAGELACVEDRFTTASGREVPLRIYTEPQNLDRCGHALESLKRAMAWDEREYGREYDLEVFNIVAVNHFNMGAMENKGLNIFNAKYVLARPDTATDQDFQGVEGVIAHEYFHNWTGNRITCRDWFQLSLKEGFTVFRDQEFSADMGSRGVKRIQDVGLLRTHQFAEDAGPLAHPVRPDSYIEINNFYTVTVYEKGAELIRMLRTLLGRAGFRRATDLYFERHDGQAVTTEDFVRCMEDASGRDLTRFRRWYDQAGTPVVTAADAYDPERREYRLTLRQHCAPTPGQPHKAPFHIPVALGLLGAGGRAIPPVLADGRPGDLLELTGPEQTFVFRDVPERPLPSLLRGLSAPVKLEYPYTAEDRCFLMAHDPDPVNRWDAAQGLFRDEILRRLESPDAALPEGLTAAFRHALLDDRSEAALVAEVLTLPGEAWLADQLEEVDPLALHAAREGLRRALAETLAGDLRARYEALGAIGPYRLEAAEIGRRRLRNLCLGCLAALDRDDTWELCRAQFEQADNMTDRGAALRLLADAPDRWRRPALEAFHRQWRNDPLVLDKWFQVQALAPRRGTLEQVRALARHPDFSLGVPNRVRSLLGAYALGNPTAFHRRDGGGYAFLVDQILRLDPLNPQVAARLLRSLDRWRRYAQPYAAAMRAQLQRVADAEVSRDLYEVAAKSLEGA